MPNSPALEAAIASYKTARQALNASETALRVQKEELQTAVAAVKALTGASTNEQIGDAAKTLVLEQSQVTTARLDVVTKRDTLNTARGTVLAQARTDQALPPDDIPEGLA